MGKQPSNRRRAWRRDKIQHERSRRADRRESNAADGELGPEQTGRVTANFGAALELEAADGSRHRCVPRRTLQAVVVGDRVHWRAGRETGVVTALDERRTVLARPVGGETKAVAANVDRLIIVTAPRPAYSTDLIDCYLVAAERSGIRPVLLFNKTDLLGEAERESVENELGTYRTVGYDLVHASTKTRDGLTELAAALKGFTSVFVGQSGVGKSSLVQALLPGEALRIGELSGELGQHTTSAARLYHLPSGGDLIDSPGVREFALWRMPPGELAEGFAEFRPYLGRCRFRDCTHLHEPGCAVREAVESGGITDRRYASYRRLVETLPGGDY